MGLVAMPRRIPAEGPVTYTTFQVARFLGVSPPTVVNWVTGGLLAAYRTPGGHRRIRRSDLIQFALERGFPLAQELEPGPVAAAPVADAKDSGMLEFDLGSLSLSLDLDAPASDQPTASDDFSEDPLGTKLALADEFVSIGDEDGARALIEEVIAEATGDMRAKAQRALANLS